jgi:hypothetical protein
MPKYEVTVVFGLRETRVYEAASEEAAKAMALADQKPLETKYQLRKPEVVVMADPELVQEEVGLGRLPRLGRG